MLRDWFWQLQTTGRGPDWLFYASVAPATTDRLNTLIRQHGLPGFAYYQVSNGLCTRHRHRSTYDLYIDQDNYTQLVANFEDDRPQNIWIYHTIAVCGNDLSVERGYGGYPGMYGATETSLIAMVAAELTLVDWSVVYGGDGYSSGQLASGTSAAELLAYLRQP